MNCENVTMNYENLQTVKEWLDASGVSLDALDAIKSNLEDKTATLWRLVAECEEVVEKSHMALDNNTPEHPEYRNGFSDMSRTKAEAENHRWMEIRKAYVFVEDLFVALEDAKRKLDKVHGQLEALDMPTF